MGRILRFTPLLAAVLLIGCGSKDEMQKPADPGKTVSNQGDGGAARLSVKHGQDPDAASIDTKPKDISVEDLIATKLPDGVKDAESYGDKRIGDFERSTYRVQGNLKSIVHRKDGDYFLVMEGKSGATAIIEVPDPKLCQGSPLLKEIQATRDLIETKYHPTDQRKDINEPATIEGVGFFGTRSRRGSGGSGSNARLMPGTGFKPGS